VPKGKPGAALDMPVALLINKWDRYSEIDYAHPENEQQKLEELVNAPQSPHRTVYNDLKSSITEGNFQIFPVSALGPNEFVQLENGEQLERPKQVNPLNSFGLEDPFIWLVQRHNAIDLRNYLDKGIKNKPCGKMGKELLNRFPAKSEESKQIKQVMWQCRRAAIKRVIVGAAIVVASWFGGETTWDAVKYRQFTVTVDNPQATNEELDDAQKWLTQYIAAPHFRHRLSQIFFLDREEAQTRLAKLQAYRDKFLWQAVETAKKENLQAALKPAKKYLQYYPSGAHAQEAHELILRAEIQQQQQDNEDALRQIEGAAQANWQDADSLNELLEQLRRVPHPEAETDTMREKRVTLDQRLSKRVVQVTVLANKERFRRTYERMMRAGNFLEAARLLSNSAQDQTLLNELKGKFQKDAILEIEQRVKKALQDDRFESANELLRMYDKFPHGLQTLEDRKKVKTLQNQVAARQDQFLYELFTLYLERDRLDRYLNEAPLQTMEEEVREYKAYLEKIDPKATLTGLKVQLQSIRWQNAYGDNDNVVRLYVDGQYFIGEGKVESKTNTTTRINRNSRSSFNAKPFDRITITVTIIEEGIWKWGDEDNGQGSVTKPVSELAAKGYGLQLRRNKDNVKTAKVYVKIIGYPEAPTLPPWRGNK
jgi:predicted acetyltransferase